MYGTPINGNVFVLPASGIGTAAAYTAGGPESYFFMALAIFTCYAAVKTAWKLLPRPGS